MTMKGRREADEKMRLRSESLTTRRVRWRLMMLGAALAFGACSTLHRGQPAKADAPAAPSAEASSGVPAPADSGAAASASPEGAPTDAAPVTDGSAEGGSAEGGSAEGGSGDANSAPPGATVAISYAHKGDYLASLKVTKFGGTEMIESRNLDPQRVASIIRFDGGVTVWEIEADTGMFSKLPVVGAGDKFKLKSVTYGKLPAHFAQVAPDSGSPEPLEIGQYYIFTARRASGALSYEAVRVESDGSLEAYDAEPRAGTSYILCCNVSSDFVQPAPPLIPQDSDSEP
jgi:hypothetical protein